MRHPLAFISPPSRRSVFLALLAWTILLTILSQLINSPLRTSAAPTGIVSFELARSPATANLIISSWDKGDQLFAAFGLGLDYLYMVSYAFTISLACLLSAHRMKGWLSGLGIWLGWGVFLAAILDGIENVGLMVSLVGHAGGFWPEISFWCATFKFAFIILGILFALAGWILPKKN
jgi:hypothetical protein